MAEINMAYENLMKLRGIQKVILYEEDIESNIDETLAQVFDFYGKFVPYSSFPSYGIIIIRY